VEASTSDACLGSADLQWRCLFLLMEVLRPAWREGQRKTDRPWRTDDAWEEMGYGGRN